MCALLICLREEAACNVSNKLKMVLKKERMKKKTVIPIGTRNVSKITSFIGSDFVGNVSKRQTDVNMESRVRFHLPFPCPVVKCLWLKNYDLTMAHNYILTRPAASC